MIVTENYYSVTATATATVTGSAVTSLFTTPKKGRSGVKVCNHHASVNLYVYESNTATAPADITTANAIHVIGPGQTLTLSVGDTVYLFVKYASVTSGVVNSLEIG